MKGDRKVLEIAHNSLSKLMVRDEGKCDADVESSVTNVIVNYLPQTMSQDDIRSLFGSVGDIESCKLVRDKVTGQSLGYGFVNYKSGDHAIKAIEALNGLRLQNKTIKVSLARPSCELIKGANLYVSGLAKSMTQRELEALFAPYGHIITSRILCDSLTGLSKGVGFVRFDLRSEAEQAIMKLNGATPPGSSSGDGMTVKFANHPNATSGPIAGLRNSIRPFQTVVASYLSPSARQVLAPLHAAGRIRYDSAPSVLASSIVQSNGNMNGNMNGWCLFVYNLAPDTDEKVVWQLFGPFGAVQNVNIVRDLGTQKCRGFGFVTMTNYEEALMAINCLHGCHLSHRVIQVSFKRSKGSSSGISQMV